jgi:hypothetical protein
MLALAVVDNARAHVPTSSHLYRCCEDWEHSQYHDSDWYCVAYDAANDTLVRVETGSTRHAGGTSGLGGVIPMTDAMRPRALAALVRLYFGILTRQEQRDAETPSIALLAPGTQVRLLAPHRCMAKDKSTADITCPRCDGSGQWTNPYRPSDKRECRACKGSGKVQRTVRTRAKGGDGKQAWIKLAAGTVATVVSQATFGTFYRNGYNQPDRGNTTVYLRLADGTEAQAPAEKLRLDRDPPSEDVVLAMAQDAANRGGYYPPFATARTSLM